MKHLFLIAVTLVIVSCGNSGGPSEADKAKVEQLKTSSETLDQTSQELLDKSDELAKDLEALNGLFSTPTEEETEK